HEEFRLHITFDFNVFSGRVHCVRDTEAHRIKQFTAMVTACERTDPALLHEYAEANDTLVDTRGRARTITHAIGNFEQFPNMEAMESRIASQETALRAYYTKRAAHDVL